MIDGMRFVVAATALVAACGLPAAAGVREDVRQGIVLPDTGSRLAEAPLDSGLVFAERRAQNLAADGPAFTEPVFGQVVRVDGAEWIRLTFDDVQLAAGDEGAMPSSLRITSLKDGAVQHLEMVHVQQWSYTSAYFNGDAVLVEILAAPSADPQPNRVHITQVAIGEPPVGDRSICGPTDDRVLSSDPRAGRMMPIGCTAWLFNDRKNCLLTAGHCGPSTSQVIQFNVPLSSAGGTPQNPPPQDQYPVDPASIQSNGGLGVGNDWSYFGVFNNSNTGLNPRDAQGGQTYQLATSIPPADARPIRVTGYGSTTSPVSPTWYLVQKTHAGPFVSKPGTSLQYQPDTTGGNSGSAVQDDVTGLVIGIHTHAGCSATAGNQGTQITYAPLQTALANPQGICDQRSLDIAFPSGLPDLVDPTTGAAISATISAEPGFSVASATLYADTGTGFTPSPMTGSADAYSGTLPGDTCGDTIRYYIEATDNVGDTVRSPATGSYTALAAVSLDIAVQTNFETNPGFTVQNTALSTGAWVIATPGNFGRSDPASDYDGSGRCFVTGAANAEDVDGGPTVLLTPAYDLSAIPGARLSYARYFETNFDDQLVIQISDDNGTTWTTLETITGAPGWGLAEFSVSDYVSLTSQVRVRFSVADNPNADITEAAVDAFSIAAPVCDTPCAADINGDGIVNFSDVAAFTTAFSAGGSAADLTGDGLITFADVSAFIDAFNTCG